MKILLLAVGLFFGGCATAYKMNNVSLGMTKAEVIAAIGSPASTSAQGETEFMSYRFSDTDSEAFYGVERPYFVRIRDGKVDAYGRAGDFDSTKDPSLTINMNKKHEGK